MKVLFTTSPGLGHSLSLVPLMWGFRSAGHQVLVASSAGSLRAALQAGLPAIDGSPDRDITALFGVHEQRAAEQGFHLPAFVGGLFGEFTDVVADRVVAAAEAWRPDLVVHSALEYAGPIAAAVLGIPAVSYSLGLPVPAEIRDAVREGARGAAQRHRVPAWPVEPLLTLDPMPASLCEPDVELGQPIRFVPYGGGDAPRPDWLLVPPPDRPRICVTLGTEVPRWAGLDVVEEVVAAAGDLDVELLLALGTSADALGPLPGNVRAFRWLPIADAAPTCVAFVHHGGPGTMLTACAAGLPQLAIPHGGDQFLYAPLLAKRGLGLVLDTPEVDRDRLGEAFGRLVGDHGLRAAAAEVRDEIAALPAPDEVADLLAGLATRR